MYMKKILFLSISLLVLSACLWSQKSYSDVLTTESFMSSYTSENRGVNLSDMDLSWFVSLNGLNNDEEIVNIYISNNEIEVLNISEYPDLGRIVADNNLIKYFGDIKYPNDIRHISLANNRLETLDWVENLTELKTLDVSNNMLEEEDFTKLASLKNLKLIYAQGNNVSDEFLERLDQYNAPYLQSIKQ